MAKRVRVKLFGFQNRGIDVDADATEGAVLGENLLLPDGTVVQTSQIINQTTIVQTSGGPAAIASTLWSLILEIPAFISALAGLTGAGLVVKGTSNSAIARTIVSTDAKITITDGDGIAGNPTFQASNWPVVKNSIETGEEYTVLSGHQLLVWDSFVYNGGNLILDGDLVVL